VYTGSLLSEKYPIPKGKSLRRRGVKSERHTWICGTTSGGGSAANHSTFIGLSLLSFLPFCHNSKRMSAGASATLMIYSIRWYFALLFHQYLFLSLSSERGTLDKSEEIVQILWQAVVILALLVERESGTCQRSLREVANSCLSHW
jgi:hypothetical protein